MYKYRKRSPIGGLAADLEARFDESENARNHSTRVYRHISMSPPPEGLYWKDFSWMAFGLSLHGPALMSQFPGGVVFRVVKFEYPLADYRPEVAALAVEGLLQQELDLPSSGISVRYDPARSDYVFDFGTSEPFSGE